jgi:hypothetical protein
MNEQNLASELERAKKEIDTLRRRLELLESEETVTRLPRTMLLDESFLKRAFAVFGHYLVAGLIVSIPFYLLAVLIMVLFR